jgi:heme-degrading monooxygenase HmoA
MFIAMNRFKVASGREADFERTWKERETYLQGVEGFVQFALLKSDSPGEYVSHSTWESREAFMAWMQSPAFAAGHRQGSLAGVLEGPPQVSTYEAIIVETPAG